MRPSLSAAFVPALALAILPPARPAEGVRRPFTLDDEMRMRAIVDARISPDGERVAYVVSTPSLERNEHEGALYIVPTAGGAAVRAGETLRIFNTPAPAPRLKWAPDSREVGLLAFAGDRPQVFAVPVAGGASRAITDEGEGVVAFDWSPDGNRIAYLTRDPISAEEERRRRDRASVIHADAPAPPTRLVVRPLDTPDRRVLTPPSHYVDAFSWRPDGRAIAYSAAARSGFTAPYSSRIYTIDVEGGAPAPIVDRPGMNVSPQFSPDGRWIAYESNESGQFEIYVRPFPESGGKWQISTAGGTQVRWRRDRKELFYVAPDGRLMAASISTGPSGQTVTTAGVVPLFMTQFASGANIVAGISQYDVAANGRFLMNVSVDDAVSAPPITIVLNWQAAMKN